MIFSEIYGSYFKAVSAILSKAADGQLTEEELTRTVMENAFGESVFTIPDKLKDESWPLLTKDYSTPLHHVPQMPLSRLEKQWLKALLLDPRILLFNPSKQGLEDVEPLFTPDQFVYYDRYSDGDNYTDEGYIVRFRIILKAIQEKRKVRIRYHGHRGIRHCSICIPYKLEYSSKDDKFRLVTGQNGKPMTINLSRVNRVQLLDPWEDSEYRLPRDKEIVIKMELYDSRNALERVMLHFSDLEKETEKIDAKNYRITLYCRKEDETEILIRILSFGPVLKVTGPDKMVSRIRDRINRQNSLDEQAATP